VDIVSVRVNPHSSDHLLQLFLPSGESKSTTMRLPADILSSHSDSSGFGAAGTFSRISSLLLSRSPPLMDLCEDSLFFRWDSIPQVIAVRGSWANREDLPLLETRLFLM